MLAPGFPVASIHLKHVSFQAAELDKLALNELGKLVLSALSHSSPTLPCSSLGSPTGLRSVWAWERESRDSVGLGQAGQPPPPLGAPSASFCLRWVEAHKTCKVLLESPGTLMGDGQGTEPLEGLAGAQSPRLPLTSRSNFYLYPLSGTWVLLVLSSRIHDLIQDGVCIC